MTSGKRNYLLLSLFDFLYLFAWSSTMAFFVIWTTQHLGISATKTGLLYSVNAFIALLMQPFFGFISDKFGLKKRLIWLLVALLLPVGPFFIYVYAPLPSLTSPTSAHDHIRTDSAGKSYRYKSRLLRSRS